jgi:hypothetical protein
MAKINIRCIWLASILFFVGVSVSGCQDAISGPITPEMDAQLMSTFEAGQITLDCQINCSGSWGGGLQNLGQLDAQGDWHDLAIQVMKIGYENDLAYYYLGHAAEGLGYYDAALQYYRISGAASTGSDPRLKCAGGGFSNLCNNVSLPNDLYARMQTVQNDIASQQAAQEAAQEAADTPTVVVHHRKHIPTTQTAAAPPPPSWIDPPPVTH